VSDRALRTANLWAWEIDMRVRGLPDGVHTAKFAAGELGGRIQFGCERDR
jgi:hypothetical protein